MKVLLPVLALSLLVACSSTRVLPREDGTYLMVATSYSDSAAHDAALDDATEYCEDRGKRFSMVSKNSVYQGADKDAKLVIGAVNQVFNPQNPHYDGSRTDDYRVELEFRCK